MKTLLVVLSGIVALSLLTTTAVFSLPTHANEIGLYTTADGYGATGTNVVWTPVEVYLVLTKPTDLSAEGGPISNVFTFECTLNFNPVPNEDLYMQSATLPPESLNIGDMTDIRQGFLEFIVGIANPGAPVIDEAVVLVTFEFINLSSTIFEVSLAPASIQSVPGEMSYLSYDYGLNMYVMHPVSGSFEDPVFVFNGEAVPAETKSFGSIKALFR